MSIFSKLFGSKKTDEKQAEDNETLSQDLEVFDNPATLVVEFEDILKSDSSPKVDNNPETLPNAIRYVVDKWGCDYLKSRSFLNVLNDFQAFKEIPAAKYIIQNMQANGYVDKLVLVNNWEIESKSIIIKYANEFGAKENLVAYVVRSLGYGLKKINDIPNLMEHSDKEQETFKDPESQTITIPPSATHSQSSSKPTPRQAPQSPPMGPYNPKDDLPQYQYPTISLLSDRRLDNDNVYVKSILCRELYQRTHMELPCAIGKKEDGKILMFDLTEAPHLMISGSSGMGVSVCFNAIITSLLYKKLPSELKLVMIDPKKIEFSLYSPLKNYFLAGVPNREAIVTNMSEVYYLFNCINKELDIRLDLFKNAAVRDVKSYNRKFCDGKLPPNKGHRFLPYIVILVDEYDEMIRTGGKNMESFIDSIARMGRATGIHLIISVQRPVSTVISAGIKANIPSRISFRVTSTNDSRNIIGISGAEKLQSPGEMIYTNGFDVVKSKCAYIDLREIERINRFISEQDGYDKAYELPDPNYEFIDPSSIEVDMQHLDPMFEDAARLIVRDQLGSTSLIQRKFAIGYNRAGRLMAQLEKAGVVGAAYGSKPREILIKDENSLENLLALWR